MYNTYNSDINHKSDLDMDYDKDFGLKIEFGTSFTLKYNLNLDYDLESDESNDNSNDDSTDSLIYSDDEYQINESNGIDDDEDYNVCSISVCSNNSNYTIESTESLNQNNSS
jgi:hypothetical protein